MNYLVAVDDCFLDAPGGMGRVAWDMALLMRRRGHRVLMLCARRPADFGKQLVAEAEGIQIVRYEKPQLPEWHPLRWRAPNTAARAAARGLKGEAWDVVHIHSLFTGMGVREAFGPTARYVATVHSPVAPEQRVNWSNQGMIGRAKILLGTPILNRLERRILADCVTVHALSEYTRSLLEALHGIGDRVTVIPHWRKSGIRRTCDKLEARRRLAWPLTTPIFFTIRHHGPRYGIDLAIRAVAPLTRAGQCVLYIGGDGPMRPTFEDLARQSDPFGGIRFTGRLTDEDLALAYQAADLFLLPTVAMECFGLITLEALSYGLPVLSTDAGAIPETMKPILPDFIAAAGDGAALREKIVAYLSGRLRAAPPQILMDYVSSRFDHDLIVPQLVRMIEGAASV